MDPHWALSCWRLSLQWWYTSLNSLKGHPRGWGIRGWMHNFWGVFLWNLFFGSWTSSTCVYEEHCAISFVVFFVCKWHTSVTPVFLLAVASLSTNGGFCPPSSWRTWFPPKELLRRRYSWMFCYYLNGNWAEVISMVRSYGSNHYNNRVLEVICPIKVSEMPWADSASFLMVWVRNGRGTIPVGRVVLVYVTEGTWVLIP